MRVLQTEHFDIQRKIVANMTTESWETIPHAAYNYRPDITALYDEYLKIKEKSPIKITFNTVLLRVLVEGLKAAPILNSHIDYKRHLVKGHIKNFENIDISLPMMLPGGKMMTINVHDFHKKTITEMAEYIADVRRRMANTNLTEVMFEVSMANTLQALKRLKLKTVICRLIGAKLGKHRVKTLSGKAKKEYYSIPESDRLTARDIEQGTITISNVGSVYNGQYGELNLIEVIPPQVCAIGVASVQEKGVVITNSDGEKELAVRKLLPLNISFDHRAIDFGDMVPFLKRLDEIFASPEIINEWL